MSVYNTLSNLRTFWQIEAFCKGKLSRKVGYATRVVVIYDDGKTVAHVYHFNSVIYSAYPDGTSGFYVYDSATTKRRLNALLRHGHISSSCGVLRYNGYPVVADKWYNLDAGGKLLSPHHVEVRRFVARDSDEHKLYCAYHKRKATIDFAGIQEQMRAIELVTPDKSHLNYFRYISNEDIKYIIAHDAMDTAWYLCTRGFSSRNIQAAIEGSVERLDRWYERHFQLGKYGYNTPNYRAKCDLV